MKETSMPLKTTAQTSLEAEFQSLARQWKEACSLLSSTSAMVADPAYQAIIELGQPVVPLLLRELEKETRSLVRGPQGHHGGRSRRAQRLG
jgi:hypothetical protein